MLATSKHTFNLLSLSFILLLSPIGGVKALAPDGNVIGAQNLKRGNGGHRAAEQQVLSFTQHQNPLPWGADDAHQRIKHDHVRLRKMLETSVKPDTSSASTTSQTGGQQATGFELDYRNVAKPVDAYRQQQRKQLLLRDLLAGAVATATLAPGKGNTNRDEKEDSTSLTTQRGRADNPRRATVSRGSGGGSKPAIKLAASSRAAMLHNVTPADMVAITASGSGVKTRNATADSSGRRSTKETVRDAAFTHRMRYQRPHSALMASRLTFLHAVDHWRNHG
ncbi:hypothetical protein Vretifemale_16907, partial [Volvox reticuliferus]